MQEIWRVVDSYEGLYEVSNTGKVRNARTKHVLAPTVHNGYNAVVLSRSALSKNFVKIDRLVAQSFVFNPSGYTYVHHRDANRLNDNADNLIWSRIKTTTGKPAKVLNTDRSLLSTHMSIADAARFYGYSPQLVGRLCKTGKSTKSGLYFQALRGRSDE